MNTNEPYKRSFLFCASIINICFLTGLFYVAWFEYYRGNIVIPFFKRGNWVMLAIYAILLLFFSKMYGGLKFGKLRKTEVILSQMLAVIFVNGIVYIQISLLAYSFLNIVPIVLMTLADFVVITLWTLLVGAAYNHFFPPWNMLLVFGNYAADKLLYKISTRKDKYVIRDSISAEESMENIAEKMKEYDAVLIGDISAVTRNDILKYCYGNSIRAYVIPKLSDIIMMGTEQINIFDTPIFLSRGFALSFDQKLMKRIVDIVLAVILLVLASPFLLLTALAVKLYDGGSVLFSQTRLTLNGKEFQIYKFRSMIENAEEDGVAKLATQNDRRITPVGKFIRKTRLDELPQIFNVLKGDMSFVGPRPERPEIMEEYRRIMPEFAYRMRVKAGLTGFAQIFGKYNTTPYDKLKLDLYYIENYSLWMDFKLILMTVKIVFKGESTEGIQEGQTTADERAEHSGQGMM